VADPMIVQPKYTAQSAARYPSTIDETAAALHRALFNIRASLWQERPNPKSVQLNAIAWSGSEELFCAVGNYDGADSYILTSPDGAAWTERANPSVFALHAIARSPTLFVAVGDAGPNPMILTSPDGITWTVRANTGTAHLYGVVWSVSLNLFCAVGEADGTDACILTSPDGVAWTERANPKNFRLYAVTASSSLLVAVGAADGTDAYILTSPDGAAWTERANPNNLDLRGVVVRDTSPALRLFVACGDDYVITSPDGVAWTRRTTRKGGLFRSAVWADPLFIITGTAVSASSPGHVETSFDGAGWVFRGATTNVLSIIGAARGRHRLCLVGSNDGTDAFIALGAPLI
jgi:hypothetical protein